MKYLALLLLVGACAPRSLVPLVPRPDTRMLGPVFMDTAASSVAISVFRAAYPNEAAVCFYGSVQDTIFDMRPARLVKVEYTRPALEDSSDNFHVWFPRTLLGGCLPKHLVGVAHSHPHSRGYCSQSDPDADLVFALTSALFAMAYCGDGQLQILWQDGRRQQDIWPKP